MIQDILQHPAFAAMRAYRQFIVYVLSWNAKDGKYDKFPVDPHTARVSGAHDPAIWLDAATAATTAQALGDAYGIGFVFTAADPFFFIDIDRAYSGSDWSPIAKWLIGLFPGACVEVSVSGTGLHIFGQGKAPQHRKRNQAYGLEFYTELRFVALTGTHVYGDSGTIHDAALRQITDQLFPFSPAEDGGVPLEWTTEPVAHWRGPADDDELIRRALRSSSVDGAFNGKAVFADLWTANADALAATYPGDPYGRSEADQALAMHLMFWTGKNCERVERLMRLSALKRDKWDVRDDYLRERTIMNALRLVTRVCQDKPMQELPGVGVVPDTDSPMPEPVTGNTFLGAEYQAQLFAGCVYVADAHRVQVPGGKLLKPDQFRAHFGGYTFAMDTANERTSRNAWEAFTESQIFRAPRVDTTTFEPTRRPGSIITRGGLAAVNLYWPIETPSKPGDASRFLRHMEKLLPDERDRAILMAYLAACVQYKGRKFKWAPILQGTPGNGKTLFSLCVAEAIGKKYVHWPKASKLGKNFNAWIANKLLYCVEDIFTPEGQQELLEDLKPMITGGTGFEMEAKGIDQINIEIKGNFLFNMNRLRGVRIEADERRYSIFQTAQQRKTDVRAAGMDSDYFVSLYHWLENEDGYAVVTHFLQTWQIHSEFNPAGRAITAPETSTHQGVVAANVGRVEQEIQEAVNSDALGFKGGWISSVKLDELLSGRRLDNRLSPARKREILESMGYVLHPGLPAGRTNNPVNPDGKKPCLYIAPGHASRVMTDAAQIARAYTDAQMPPP